MREDFKSQNFTFGELAKLFGEKWQMLAPAYRDSYESQASVAKDMYDNNVAAYKKTSQCLKYSKYLLQFREKQAKHNLGKQTNGICENKLKAHKPQLQIKPNQRGSSLNPQS